jgi:antitoxin component HigA of HigAB toxin-antitoxin module
MADTAQQITVTSPTQLRNAANDVAFAQALARDIETIAYQLNQLSRQIADLKKQLGLS